jgi:glutathione peroxidase
MTSVYDFAATDISGVEQALADYRGRVLLIVNTASQCGFTPQYGPLQELYDTYSGRGLVILGFPCDQFGHQEPGDEGEISEFCESQFGVTFPMFSKIDVNGKNAHPLYKWLKSEKSGVLGGAIKWNFTKFLVDADGNVVQRYGSTTTPDSIAADIEKLLPVE